MDPIVGGPIIFGILWLIAALMGKRPRRHVIGPEPESLPPAPPEPPEPPPPEPVQPAGIRWAGRTFTVEDTRAAGGIDTPGKEGAGAWRAHVRPIYGPIMTEGAARELEGREKAIEYAVPRIRAAVRDEGETAARLAELNLVYMAWTDTGVKKILNEAARA